MHNTAQGVEHRLRSEVLGWYEVDEVFLAVFLLKSKATVRGVFYRRSSWSGWVMAHFLYYFVNNWVCFFEVRREELCKESALCHAVFLHERYHSVLCIRGHAPPYWRVLIEGTPWGCRSATCLQLSYERCSSSRAASPVCHTGSGRVIEFSTTNNYEYSKRLRSP